LDEFRSRSSMAIQKKANLQFAVTEGAANQFRVPQKPIIMRNTVLNTDWRVQPPDIAIDGTGSYELSYWKNMSQFPNAFSKKSSDL